LRAADPRVGEVYLSAGEIAGRVAELGAALAGDYAGREPLLVAPLKASIVFLADLSRAMPILHHIDFVELAAYNGGGNGGSIKLLKDLDAPIEGRDVVVIEDVIDTGLTLNYLRKTFTLRRPASFAAVTLLDRPYRRLVDDLPVRHVGFTVPDEFFVGYGFDVDERYRNLPDLHMVREQPPGT
jgi:hypoxanthine phosphoribosyltransferase